MSTQPSESPFREMPKEDLIAGNSKQDVLRKVLRDAIVNVIYFAIGTFVVILIGHKSWQFGIILAAIEALFAALQSFKVMFLIVSDVFLYITLRLGKRRPEDGEAELRWATFIRTIEFGIWFGCIFVLYRFFFR